MIEHLAHETTNTIRTTFRSADTATQTDAERLGVWQAEGAHIATLATSLDALQLALTLAKQGVRVARTDRYVAVWP